MTFTDVTGAGLDDSTIFNSQPKFTLSGAGAGNVAIQWSPTLISGNTYRFPFTGTFGGGPVNVNFIPGSFADTLGNLNQAATQSFNVQFQPSLWIDTPQAVVEGKQKMMIFTVRLSGPVSRPVMVKYATVNGTAIGGKNYRPAHGILIFRPHKPLSQTIKVPILDDKRFGNDASFRVVLSPLRGNVPIAVGTAAGTILEGDRMPQISVNSISVKQGASGVTKATLTVRLSAKSTLPTTVQFATADGTATVADGDYQAAGGTLTFAPGVTKQTITVLVNPDPQAEPKETFQVLLSDPAGGVLSPHSAGTVTIINTHRKPKRRSSAVRAVDEALAGLFAGPERDGEWRMGLWDAAR